MLYNLLISLPHPRPSSSDFGGITFSTRISSFTSHTSNNPFRFICQLYIERNDSTSREVLSFWITGIQVPPTSLPSCDLLGNRTPSVRVLVVALTSLIFVSREKASRNSASLSLIDEIKHIPKPKSLLDHQCLVPQRCSTYINDFIYIIDVHTWICKKFAHNRGNS